MMEQKQMFCTRPFTNIEVRSDENIYLCCCGWTEYPVGNWAIDSFEAIWNGERAREFRRTILDGSYRLCKSKRCIHYSVDLPFYTREEINEKFHEVCPPPKTVDFCHEKICNVRCVMCRDKHIHNTKEEIGLLDSRIETVFLPMTVNAELVIINGEGEALASKHCRKLMKTISQKNQSVKFSIRSNGVLTDKNNFESLGILDKIDSVVISLHAVKKRTYDRIVLDSDFDRIIKNIEWLSSMKKAGNIKHFTLVSVVSRLNYREMISFVKLAKKYNAMVNFLEYFSWGTKMGQQYVKMAVFKEYHPQYNNYIRIINKIMHNEIYRKTVGLISPLLCNLQPISAGKWWKYRFKDIKQWLRCRLDWQKKSYNG
jgi:molybdenum cofactor biosynthesis enzyme MoaA